MKRNLIAALIVVFLLSFGGTALAAVAVNNPFTDVPANHWSYAAVQQLVNAGIITGYSDGTFRGDKTLTRYEMAAIVANAISKEDKADQATKAVIDKLTVEYSKDLEAIGVRVQALEKKSDKLTISGFIHLNDQVWNNSGMYKGTGGTPYQHDGHFPAVGTLIAANYKVNDRWKVTIMDEAIRDFKSGGYWADSGSFNGNANASERNNGMWAEGSFAGGHMLIGRYDYVPLYGLVIAPTTKAVDGIQYAFGNDKFKTTVNYGYIRENWSGATESIYTISGTTQNPYAAVEFSAALSKDSNLKAAYHKLSNDDHGVAPVINSDLKIWEVGADKLLAKNLKLYGSYAKSTADDKNKAYVAGLIYGHKAIGDFADINTPGSYVINARYIKADAYATIAPDSWWNSIYATPVGIYGFKGPELNAQIVLDKNIDILIWADFLKGAAANSPAGSFNTVKAQLDFYF
ncbi:MAG TPA: S-layer homology domain-containing protein [Negativicutes bacterium]